MRPSGTRGTRKVNWSGAHRRTAPSWSTSTGWSGARRWARTRRSCRGRWTWPAARAATRCGWRRTAGRCTPSTTRRWGSTRAAPSRPGCHGRCAPASPGSAPTSPTWTPPKSPGRSNWSSWCSCTCPPNGAAPCCAAPPGCWRPQALCSFSGTTASISPTGTADRKTLDPVHARRCGRGSGRGIRGAAHPDRRARAAAHRRARCDRRVGRRDAAGAEDRRDRADRRAGLSEPKPPSTRRAERRESRPVHPGGPDRATRPEPVRSAGAIAGTRSPGIADRSARLAPHSDQRTNHGRTASVIRSNPARNECG